VTDFLAYEQPLNERIRSFLRLETLFIKFAFHVKHGSVWDNPATIDVILDLLSFSSRSDVKIEAIKELERQHGRLERLARRPQIDQSQLDSLLDQQMTLIERLKSLSGQLGQETQAVELLNAIRQKSSVPGCICDFDLPVFKYWLTLPEEVKRSHLEHWFSPFQILEEAITLILKVLRQSANETEQLAHKGFYQQAMDTNQAVQLLRISVPDGVNFYPEISAGKHRFSLRFLTNANPESRPEQTTDDIHFRLGICAV
jgi:cell division protein ZapD